jgi:hypothetical protein
MMLLNLGCSDDLKLGYVNVDNCIPYQFAAELLTDAAISQLKYGMFQSQDKSFFLQDLTERWKFEDSSADEIYAKDVFEHISNSDFPGNKGKIWVMNESYRVLKSNGVLEMLVPCVHLRDGRVNLGAFADPTHASFWTHDDRYYFCEEWNNPQGERGRLGPAYGISCLFGIIKWELVEYGAAHERRSKIHAVLRAVK